MRQSLLTNRFRLLRILLAAAVMSTVFAATGGIAGAQSTAQTWEVQVGGGVEPKPPVSFEPMAYGPDPLTIHVGDKVVWAPVLGHTVTFLGSKPAPALILPGSAPGELMAGPGFASIGVTLGAGGLSASYDGTNQLSSGDLSQVPNATPVMTITFTKAGTYAYLCLFHQGMRGTVEVRDASAALPETPAQAKTRGQVTLGAITSMAQALPSMIKPLTAGTIHTAWPAWATASARACSASSTATRPSSAATRWCGPSPTRSSCTPSPSPPAVRRPR